MNDLDLCFEVIYSVRSQPSRHIRHWISQKPLEICLVPKDHQEAIAYGESNDHVTDDVTWSWEVKLPIVLLL